MRRPLATRGACFPSGDTARVFNADAEGVSAASSPPRTPAFDLWASQQSKARAVDDAQPKTAYVETEARK